MIDAAVTAVIAALSGLGYLNSRLHSRIHELDKRLDGVELRLAGEYVPREELTAMLTRFEDHMIRIEKKLDNLHSSIS